MWLIYWPYLKARITIQQTHIKIRPSPPYELTVEGQSLSVFSHLRLWFVIPRPLPRNLLFLATCNLELHFHRVPHISEAYVGIFVVKFVVKRKVVIPRPQPRNLLFLAACSLELGSAFSCQAPKTTHLPPSL